MVNDEIERKAKARLAKIAGQVRGIEKMIDDRRYCVDILTQVEAVRSALAGLGKLILTNHLETCVVSTLSKGSKHEKLNKIKEITDIYARFCRGG